MRSLITGIGGFAGGHLAAALLSRDEVVAGYTIDSPSYPQLEPFADRLRVFQGDVRDGERLTAAIAEFRPDVVFHLAAVTHVAQAWQKRRQTLETNIVGTAAVFEAACQLDPKPTVLLASSGQVYGAATEGQSPVSEANPSRPLNPYAASKRCAEILALQAWEGESLPTTILRTFNFTGPWQSPDFVCSDFARQIAWAEAGLGPAEITVGNLEAGRDFSDVRDIVEGYILAADNGAPGRIYNLASGKAACIGDILDQLLAMTRTSISVQQDPQRLRPADPRTLVGDASRARTELGWQPRVPLAETLKSVLDFWRQQAAESDQRTSGK